MGLFLPDGALLDVSAGLGHVEQLSVYSEAGGPLWVRVFHGEGPYHLTLESAPFEPADVYEPNDTPDTAAELEPGEYAELVCGGEDFYAVEVGAGQTLRVTLRFAHEAGDLELALEDPQTGEALALSSGVTDREVAEVQAEGAGWVWVHVDSYGGEVPYSMSVTLE